jgi:hypothetical protein
MRLVSSRRHASFGRWRHLWERQLLEHNDLAALSPLEMVMVLDHHQSCVHRASLQDRHSDDVALGGRASRRVERPVRG